MAWTSLNGYPANLGGKVARVAYIKGPTSYVNGTGQTIIDSSFRSLDYVCASMTVSGTYNVQAQPKTAGAGQTWYLRWFVTATGAEVTNATNLSAETVQFMVVGG